MRTIALLLLLVGCQSKPIDQEAADYGKANPKLQNFRFYSLGGRVLDFSVSTTKRI